MTIEASEIASVDRLVAMSIADARCDKTYPPGTIGVISADLARYASFSMSLAGVKYPYSTSITWQRGCDIVNNCNKLVESFTGDWLWIMGDDHEFDVNVLVRLLSRMYDNGCQLVAPLCLSRQAPFKTVIGIVNEAEKTIVPKTLQACHGLQPVDVVGSAGLLINRAVFDKVEAPWFEAGSITRMGLGEDWWFCIKAGKAGFTIWVDSDIKLGHTTSMTVWPVTTPGQEGAHLALGGNYGVNVLHRTVVESA